MAGFGTLMFSNRNLRVKAPTTASRRQAHTQACARLTPSSGNGFSQRYKVTINAISTLSKFIAELRTTHRLAGLVVKASAAGAEDVGFEYRLRRALYGVESYQ